MEKEKIKIGIIGMGRMGITHYSIINSHPQAEIISVADTSAITLDLMKKYIKNLQVFKDYKQLIDVSKPDAIVICTPPNLNYQIIKYAFANEINVFCEKPLTADKEQAKELAEMFNTSDLVNQVGYGSRSHDIFVKTKKLIESDIIGDVVRFKSEMFSCAKTKKSSGDSWREKRENGGGVVFEMASHLIDLNNFLFGPALGVRGTVMNSVFSNKVEDIVSSTLLYGNGLSGTIFVNWSDESYRKPMISIDIFGTKGKIVADFYGYKIYLLEENGKLNLRKGWNIFTLPDVMTPVPFYVRGNEFTRQLYYFIDLISKKETKKLCDFNDGVKTLEIIEQLFTDAENNKI
jgi:predicted dehydrogenase